MSARASAQATLLAGITFLTACSGTPERREADHLKKGRQYTDRKDFKKAVIEFKIASQNMPKHAEPVYLLGMTYLGAGSPGLAVEAFRKALALDPENEPSAYQLALLKAATSRPDLLNEAKTELAAWAAAHPNNGEALANMGLAEAKLGNPSEALRLLEAGLAKDPSLLRVAASAIAVYATHEDVASAKQTSRELADKLPNSPDAAILRAQVSLATKDFADADAQISHALSLQRDFQPALQLRLRRELMSGDQANAEETTQELSRLPEKRMWSAYARILFSEKKVDQGIAEFERALKEHDNDVQLRDDYAITLLAAGRRKEAEAVVAGAIAKSPKDERGLLIRTALEIDRGSLDAAAKDVQTLQELKAFSAQLSYQESRIFAARGESLREGDLLAEALKSEPRMLTARLELARLLVGSGKARNALTILDQAPDPQRHSARYILDRNMALMASGEWDQTRKNVDAALAHKQSSGFLFQDAVLRAHVHDLPGARKSLDAAFRLAPTDAATLNLLGDLMRRQGEVPQYIALVKDAAAQNPGSPLLQRTIGDLLVTQGDAAGARAAFEAAKAAGDAVNSEIEIALIDLRAGRLDPARDRLLALVKDHDNARARISLAEIEIRRGSVDSALRDYLAAIRLEPNNIVAMNNMAGYLSTRQKKYDDAIFWSQKALALAPGNPVVEDTLGWAYYLSGKYDAALPYLEKSARTLDRPAAHYHLAASLLRAGDRSRAQKEYETALKEDPKSPERSAIAPLFPQP